MEEKKETVEQNTRRPEESHPEAFGVHNEPSPTPHVRTAPNCTRSHKTLGWSMKFHFSTMNSLLVQEMADRVTFGRSRASKWPTTNHGIYRGHRLKSTHQASTRHPRRKSRLERAQLEKAEGRRSRSRFEKFSKESQTTRSNDPILHQSPYYTILVDEISR
ncbi:unnamed protein product [Microthlaspi erraticum]|uniref:Uncharacterized protein n=1 Tax=Microthlaspi erraticum TaxID=1685480 RepID=A0A6D2IY51_9BRAS|nr:unnamed protein product [Microthlaspi erraticum]